MDGILPAYHVSDATWFYLSLLLIAAVFVRFSRLWSLRNLDLLLLLSLSPGLLIVRERPEAGYAWLFTTTGLLLLRLFFDGRFQRRPRLEQNLNSQGLGFLCVAAFAFLTTTVVTEPPPDSTMETVRKADQLLQRQDAIAAEEAQPKTAKSVKVGPAAPVLAAPAVPISNVVAAGNGAHADDASVVAPIAARLIAILSHVAVIVGLFVLGSLHFRDPGIGLAMAALYLLLPCTAYNVGEVNHVLPAALVLWAFVAYRRPMTAGSLMGLACGTLFFPIFLLPLWATFYDRRGALRFGLALCLVAAVLLGSVVLTSADVNSFTQQTIGSIDWNVLGFRSGGETDGFWSTHDAVYRIPVFVAFLVMLVVLTVWPRRKNLEQLMAHSTAIVVGTQFWYPQQGGIYLLWYLPLLLLVVFRPRLTQHAGTGFKQTGTEAQQPVPPTPQPAGTNGGGRFFR